MAIRNGTTSTRDEPTPKQYVFDAVWRIASPGNKQPIPSLIPSHPDTLIPQPWTADCQQCRPQQDATAGELAGRGRAIPPVTV